MAIPRGSINHDIFSDLKNFVRTYIDPKICKKASSDTIKNLRNVLSKRYPKTYFFFNNF